MIRRPQYRNLPRAVADPHAEERLRRAIFAAIRAALYEPLAPLLKDPPTTLKNAAGFSSLIGAIGRGQIVYKSPRFVGRLNAGIARDLRAIGAVWNPRMSGYDLVESDLPRDVFTAIRAAERVTLRRSQLVEKALQKIIPVKNTDRLKFSKLFDEMILQNEGKLDKTLASMTIKPRLTEAEKLRLQVEWRDNMLLDVKTFVDAEVKSLRNMVAKNVLAGDRFGNVVESIESSFRVSKSKAKFLASQETRLLLGTMQELRCQKAGVDEYTWHCVNASPKHPVRPMHKALDGKVFKFSQPPVTNSKGDRNNPGMDYNCRCQAIPRVRILN